MLRAAATHYCKRRVTPVDLAQEVSVWRKFDQYPIGSGFKKAQGLRPSSVGPKSPPGYSDRTGYGPFRHASSADWFMA